MLTEAKKSKKKEPKPKVEKAVQDTVDPNTGQPIEVTKPAKAMTGNPANPVIVYPTTGGQSSVVDARNPMRNSQTALLQSHTEKSGMLLREYIDYARGKIVQGIGQTEIPKPPTVGDNGNEPMNADKSGELGTDADAPEGEGKFGDVNQRLRRRSWKRGEYAYHLTPGGDDADYVSEETTPSSRPLAAPGLTSYRYKGRFGYVMIGAKDHDDAIREANRSLTSETAQRDKLEIWNGSGYEPVR